MSDELFDKGLPISLIIGKFPTWANGRGGQVTANPVSREKRVGKLKLIQEMGEGKAEVGSTISKRVAMGAIIFEAVFFPIFIVLGILAGKQRKVLQDRRIDEYRNSSESRLLKLND
jgi:hypothetical protein